ncbi:hypothetical protein [Skermania sp. ID1734]|uniref:hypothetical protein n=1 Tax=Skermania sp. ID1734 TaxID=2597516 RepID=UPI00163D4854|nr:hypothetical protein [Skermania sp. ID1734]
MQVGDRVKLHARGVSVFLIVAIDEGQASVLSERKVPGAYEFHTPMDGLVLADEADCSD